ncbi:hypothetical protein NQ015_10520 [Corynebacterium sp. 153RC1]|uniref:hypothetical protein n=1 Tax=unclassified Corynebacterium TaxID=2624378 RepID=UPI00211C02F5|nr:MULTISPECIES: hypothetical protein [unclassified Corynebacterium]MCQ9366486.1 hypothetical protein [Corynebacterium sp. 70RC1]MCQ9353391.1 hypothetical protein [Corynebacterium sp. 209RC1]MCQ9355664.1 hypothetical protein [Corynebacterium sp. 1222RC1]MCQ9357857.1 hypothetical protein [Corynebacterium sp. 122RC1]MCQ9360041.1 hypothetical protein [Corynebacterium sp. 142RC1]
MCATSTSGEVDREEGTSEGTRESMTFVCNGVSACSAAWPAWALFTFVAIVRTVPSFSTS